MRLTTKKLKDLMVLFDSKRIPLSSRERSKRKGEYPYYGATGILDYVDDYLFDGRYILLGEDGTVQTESGKPILQMVSGKFWVSNHAHIIKNSDLVDFDFLYYLLMNTTVSSIVTGAVQPKISQGNLNNLEVTYPENILDQKRIAKVLKALDDKINNNILINKNLLDEAYSIFKSWFVDFELTNGVKPDNWRSSDIYELTNIIYGAPFASRLFNNNGNGKPIVRIRDLGLDELKTFTTEIHPKRYLLQKGDIVVGMDGEFRPYIWSNGEAWLNQRVCVFENKREKGKMFLLFTIKPQLDFIERTEAATTVIHIGKNDFDKFISLIPDEDTMNRYESLTSPMYDLIVTNNMENIELKAIRNELLPKLMSGEIDSSKINTKE